MMTFKTFRFRVHDKTHSDIDTVLNTLPPGTCVEGFAAAADELFVVVSHYERYKNEIAREVVNMELRANK